MPDFVWRAATASGQITEGRITSASAALALKQLRSQGLAPISLDDQALGGALVDSVAAQSEKGFAPVKAKVDKGPVKAADVLAAMDAAPEAEPRPVKKHAGEYGQGAQAGPQTRVDKAKQAEAKQERKEDPLK